MKRRETKYLSLVFNFRFMYYVTDGRTRSQTMTEPMIQAIQDDDAGYERAEMDSKTVIP